MNLFEAESYIQFFCSSIETQKTLVKGVVRNLSLELGCHTTFISLVIRGKAHLNMEQALSFCHFFNLNSEETEYFMDLVQRDRAGNEKVRQFYQSRLDQRNQKRNDFRVTLKIRDRLKGEHEERYFSKFVHQWVHSLVLIPEYQTVERLSMAIGLPPLKVKSILEELKEINLVKFKEGLWTSTESSIHIGKDSVLLQRFHTNIRLKALADFNEGRNSEKALNFSLVSSLSKKDAKKIKEKIIELAGEARKTSELSKPECAYVLALDFIPLTE